MTRMPPSEDYQHGYACSDEALHESDARFRLLCESLRDPFVRVAMDGRIVECNGLYCQLLGYSAQELRTLTYQDLTPARWHGLEDAIVAEQILPRGHSQVYEKEYRRKDGTVIPVELRTVLERDGAGRPLAMWAIVRDIGERKLAEQELTRARREAERRAAELEAVLRAVPAAVWLAHDAECRRISGNPTANAWLGLPDGAESSLTAPDGARPARFRVRHHGRELDGSELPVQRAATGVEVRDFEEEIVLDDGSVRHALGNAMPLWDEHGKPRGSVAAFVDITERKAAEEALRASELRYRTLVDATSAVTWSCPSSGLQVEPQPSWMAFTGQTAEEMLGVGWRDAVHPDDRAAAAERWADAVARGEPFFSEHRIRRHDGAWRWMSVHAAPIRDRCGQVVEWIGMNLDIAERRAVDERLRADAERLAAVIEAQREIASVRSDGTAFLQAVLARMSRLTGAEGACLEMVEGEEMVYVAASGLAEGFVGLRLKIAQSFSGLCLTGREVQRCDDSETDPRVDRAACRRIGLRSMVAIPLRYGDDLFGVLKLMSSRVGAFDADTERTLRLMGEFLGATVARRRAQEALRDASRRKDEFLAILAHELRNPLAPIRNSLYVLERVAPGGELALRAQAVIDRQVAHLTRLVDDLLEITRISRGKIELQRERLDLCALVRRAAEDYRETFAQSRLALELTLPSDALWVSADRTRIAQTVGNLLANAAKFTPAGGQVAISVERSPDLAQALLRVRDTGIGIAPELLPRLFEPFAQGDTTLDRSRGGLGLGLATVKALVEMHGGSASVASAGPGEGAEVTVRLPLERAEPPAEPAGEAPAPESGPRRVLVIEDNLDAAESLRVLLGLCGHIVAVAFSGPAGVEMARGFGPDLVLCDIGLPGMDGYAVARTLRGDPALRTARLVALSGYAAPEDVARAREAGFDAHLAKPPSLDKLEEALREAGRKDSPS